MQDIIEKLKIIEKRTNNEIVIISDLTKLFLQKRIKSDSINTFMVKFIEVFLKKKKNSYCTNFYISFYKK